MLESCYWNEDGFGSELPENWEEIVDEANDVIKQHMEENGLDETDNEMKEFSQDLWERYCSTGTI